MARKSNAYYAVLGAIRRRDRCPNDCIKIATCNKYPYRRKKDKRIPTCFDYETNIGGGEK